MAVAAVFMLMFEPLSIGLMVAALLAISRMWYKPPCTVATGIVAAIEPLPWPENVVEPMLTGEANEPLASESCAVIVTPLKLAADTAKPTFRPAPAQIFAPNWLMASVGCPAGVTVTLVVVVAVQVF